MTWPQARYPQRTLRVLVVEGGDADGVLASASVVGVDSAAGVHDSGQTHCTGHTLAPRLSLRDSASVGITKEGRKELRYVLVQAAWHAVETNDFWIAEFERLCHRLSETSPVPSPAVATSLSPYAGGFLTAAFQALRRFRGLRCR